MARTMLPPASKSSRNASKALTKSVRRYPDHRRSRLKRKLKDGGEVSLILLATAALAAFIVYTVKESK
jgi:hypothetical protein